MLKKIFFLCLMTITIACLQPVDVIAQVTLEPFGIAVAVEHEDTLTVEMTLNNAGDNEVAYSIHFETPPEEEDRARGPRRDEVDLSGRLFAVIQQTAGMWAWMDDQMMNPILERLDPDDIGEGYHTYRNVNDWNDMEFENYDAIVVAAGEQNDAFTQAYNNNLERFEAYVADGGAAYFETAFGDCPIQSPGGIVNAGGWEANGRLLVSPDPEEDNYSRFAEICHESQPDFWELGHIITGNTWLDSHYEENQFQNNEDIGWYQVLAEKEQAQLPCVVVYGFGEGTVMTVGTGPGKAWSTQRNEGQWGSIAAEILYFLTEGASPWVVSEPTEGLIEAGGSSAIDVVFQPPLIDEGTYEMRMIIDVNDLGEERDNPEQIEVSLVMSLVMPVARIVGVVSDADGNVINGAVASIDRYLIERSSDEEGMYSFDNLPLGQYEIAVVADDYLPFSEVVELGQDGDLEFDITLLQAMFRAEPNEIGSLLMPGESEQFAINVTNEGSGPLAYTAETRLRGEANVDPWNLRRSYAVGEAVEDSRIQGAVFVNDMFYVSGANNREPLMYVFNREGELVNSYNQQAGERYGYKDLAYDGTLIWGAGGPILFGFTPEGELQSQFEAPQSPCNNLAWDTQREVLYTSGTTTDITAVDGEGNIISELDRQDIRIYGLAFYENDPDNHQLYIYHKINDVADQIVSKMNVDDGNLMDVIIFDPDIVGSPVGAFITDSFDLNSVVFISVVNDGGNDRVDVWQLDSRTDWMQIEPIDGVVDAGSNQEFSLTLDATGLQLGIYEGELYFDHNGVGGESIIAISLEVSDEEPDMPPSIFNLLTPQNDLYTEGEDLNFTWEESIDPNQEDEVNYTIWFKADEDSVSYQTDGLEMTLGIADYIEALQLSLDADQSIEWWVAAHSTEFSVDCFERFNLNYEPNSIHEEGSGLPLEFALQGVYPNPFNSMAVVTYSLPKVSQVVIDIFDMTGRLAMTLVNSEHQPGIHTATMNAGHLTSGQYVVRFQAANHVQMQKLVLVK
ncbi:MAG: T9SS type A sorting domain-containing protein [Calditrichaeota bacterium]|nr:T9SS type A sorting domain-containing protein [Calditrichota bacterium]